MLAFKDHSILENFKNFIGPNSAQARKKYVDQVWDLLQASYKKQGGIKGSGFGSKEEMINIIPFWKIFTRGDKVITVAMYKDKAGRKGVAYATDGSDDGKDKLASIFKADLDKSYSEMSGAALGFLLKNTDPNVLKPFFMYPKEVQALLKGKEVTLLGNADDDNEIVGTLSDNDQKLWAKWPALRKYFYVRVLSGEPKLKMSIGTSHIHIF